MPTRPANPPSGAATRPGLHPDAWPPGLAHDIDDEIRATRRSLWQNLVDAAARVPDKAALIFLDAPLSYRDLVARAENLAGWLRAQGVARGDRVLLCGQNSAQFAIAFFGILRADAVVVPVNPMNKADELGHYITDPQARVAIVASDVAPQWLAADRALPAGARLRAIAVFRYVDALDGGLDDADPGALPAAWLPWLGAPRPADARIVDWRDALRAAPLAEPQRNGLDDLAVLPYTSGTTGLPKGCLHTHGTLMQNVVASARWNGFTTDAVNLAVVPMFHITGLVIVLNAPLATGGTLIVLPRWDRRLAADAIRRWQVTHWTNIPTMIIDLVAMPDFDAADLASLTYIGGGGAAMPAAIAERLEASLGLRYVEGYGLTETAAPTHSNPAHRPRRACLGIPFVGIDAMIVDPLTLAPLPPGEAGEIVVHGPQVFKGYWGRPEATADAFFEHGGRRFFRTGDLGRVDAEGYYFITDRLKRMINASGFKVWPAEVEALMYRHPAVQEACVIASRDAYRGETVKAIVVLRPQAVGRVDARQIIDWCREQMAAYKVPRVVAFADQLPRSGSGKVLWRALQEREDAQGG